ncbi:MAG TPA: hypothetical protein VMU06_20755 [Stellaceae bacterium]|nr:hypothetical protein [Stellaceae bacterium]
MVDSRLKNAQKAMTVAVREMEAALIANPLLADPLMAAAQVLEDLGQIIVGETRGPKKGRRKRPRKARGKGGKKRGRSAISSSKKSAAAKRAPRR